MISREESGPDKPASLRHDGKSGRKRKTLRGDLEQTIETDELFPDLSASRHSLKLHIPR